MSSSPKKMPDLRMLGKVKKEDEKTISIFGRRLVVWVKEFESGVQRCGAFFADKNRTWLTKQNKELRKKIQELEERLKKK
jgi:hypothetical protein